MSDKVDANDVAAKYGAEKHGVFINQKVSGIEAQQGEPVLLSGLQMLNRYRQPRKEIIHGLLREGEIMNLIAAPKTGKSWITLALALAVSHGLKWFDFDCENHHVLLIDNELHRETLAYRYGKMCTAMNVPIDDRISFMSLRGNAKDLRTLDDLLHATRQTPEKAFKLIILDAFYRFIPEGVREEDNAQMTGLYNLIDIYAKTYQTAFAIVHHTSKGLQGAKGVTDVGSGAGAISRAADVHLVLRPHEEPEHFVLDAAVRSFEPIQKVVFKREHPIWVKTNLDPTKLEGNKKKKDAEKELNKQALISGYLTDTPQTAKEILCAAREKGHSKDHIEDLLGALKRSEYAIQLRGQGKPYLFGTNRAKLVAESNKV